MYSGWGLCELRVIAKTNRLQRVKYPSKQLCDDTKCLPEYSSEIL